MNVVCLILAVLVGGLWGGYWMAPKPDCIWSKAPDWNIKDPHNFETNAKYMHAGFIGLITLLLILAFVLGGKKKGPKPPEKVLVPKKEPKKAVVAKAPPPEVHRQKVDESHYVHYLGVKKDCSIIYFDIEKGHSKKSILTSIQMMPWRIESIHLEDSLYIVGGEDTVNKTYLNNTYFYDTKKDTGILEEKAPMQVKRCGHVLVTMAHRYLYALGGMNKGEAGQNIIPLDTCECYDITTDSWHKIHELTEPKFWLCGCSFGNHYIYIFGGTTKGDDVLDHIDRRNTLDDGAPWERVNLNLATDWTPIMQAACVQISKTEILIYGGTSGSKVYKDTGYVLNTKNFNMEICAKMPAEERFYRCKPMIFDDKLYCIGYKSRDVYTFDLATRSFGIIPKEKWLLN